MTDELRLPWMELEEVETRPLVCKFIHSHQSINLLGQNHCIISEAFGGDAEIRVDTKTVFLTVTHWILIETAMQRVHENDVEQRRERVTLPHRPQNWERLRKAIGRSHT